MISRREIRALISFASSALVYWIVEKQVVGWHLRWTKTGLLELNAGALMLLTAGLICAEIAHYARTLSVQRAGPARRGVGFGDIVVVLLTMFSSLGFLVALFWVANRLGTAIPS